MKNGYKKSVSVSGKHEDEFGVDDVSSDSNSDIPVPKKAVKKKASTTMPASKPAAKSSKATSKVHYKTRTRTRTTLPQMTIHDSNSNANTSIL